MFLHLLRRVTMNLLPLHYEVAMMMMVMMMIMMMLVMMKMIITFLRDQFPNCDMILIKAAASFLLQVPRRSCTRRTPRALPENRTNTI